MGPGVSRILPGRNGILFASINGYVVRSLDNGLTWSASLTESCYNLVIDKSGFLYASAPDQGVHRSTNDGETWEHMGGDRQGISLAIIRNGWLLSVSYSAAACYRSTDRGATWNPLHGLPGYGVFLVYNSIKNTIFLRTHYHGANVSCWSSTDDGDSWTLVRRFSYTTNYPGFFMTIDSSGGEWFVDSDGQIFSGFTPVARISGARVLEFDPSGVLMVGGSAGFRFSSDRGATWQSNIAGMTDPVVTAIAIRPDRTILVGTATGKIFRSTRPIIE
jgi:hypothetical protein